MIDIPLKTALKALASDIMRPLDISDSDSAAQLKQSFLQHRVLATYRDQLAGLQEDKASVWLMERVASLEARVMALQMAVLNGSAPAPSASTPLRAIGAGQGVPSADFAEALPDRVLVLCDETLSQRGFYDVEHDIDGRAFRWMGPHVKSTLFLPRVKAPFEVRFVVYSVFTEASVDQAKFSIDGSEWTPATREDYGDGTILRARATDAIHSEDQRVRIDIDVGVNESPSDKGQDDTRRLSFAISRIELVHVED